MVVEYALKILRSQSLSQWRTLAQQGSSEPGWPQVSARKGRALTNCANYVGKLIQQGWEYAQ